MSAPVDWHARAASLRLETRLFIDGAFVDAADGGRLETSNPATGETLATVAAGNGEDVDRAVRAARKAYRSGIWSRSAPRHRMEVLHRASELIRANAEHLALLDTLDMGKPIGEALGFDAPEAALCFRFFAEAIDKMEGAVGNTARDALHMITRAPIGVVGCIVPWNFPLMMAAWKVAPALAAGNSVVLKPAEQTPLSALALAALLAEAGVPDGVFNVVNGTGSAAGETLAMHMDVDKIGFTGSTAIGKHMLVCAGRSNMKRVAVECGGKSPQIIMDDVADLDTAVATAAGGIFFNQGEVCSAGSRILVHQAIYDDFVARFAARTRESVTVGNPLDPDVTMGPLVSDMQKRRVLSHIDAGLSENCRLLSDAGSVALPEGGHFVAPAIFADVSPDATIAREEIFGPVAAIIPFRDAEEAIAIANDSIYGLAAGLWTSDLGQAHRMARDIEAGIIWVNCYGESDMTLPWGGTKQTGHGRDKCFQALLDSTETKSIWIRL